MKLDREVQHKFEDIDDDVLLNVVNAIRRRAAHLFRPNVLPPSVLLISDEHQLLIAREAFLGGVSHGERATEATLGPPYWFAQTKARDRAVRF
jgi:hypothetical protein